MSSEEIDIERIDDIIIIKVKDESQKLNLKNLAWWVDKIVASAKIKEKAKRIAQQKE